MERCFSKAKKALFFTSEFTAQVIPLHFKLLLNLLVPIYEVIIYTYMNAEDFFMTMKTVIKIPTGMNVFGWLQMVVQLNKMSSVQFNC